MLRHNRRSRDNETMREQRKQDALVRHGSSVARLYQYLYSWLSGGTYPGLAARLVAEKLDAEDAGNTPAGPARNRCWRNLFDHSEEFLGIDDPGSKKLTLDGTVRA